MSQFQEFYSKLVALKGEYQKAHEVLQEGREIIDSNPTARRHSVREIFFTLLTMQEILHHCASLNKEVEGLKSRGLINSHQFQQFKAQYNQLENMCQRDDLKCEQIDRAPLAEYDVNLLGTAGEDALRAFERIELFKPLLKGFSKIAYAALGKITNWSIDYTGNFGLASADGRVIIDANLLNQPTPLFQTVANHEIGHHEKFLYDNVTPNNMIHIDYVSPDALDNIQNDGQYHEMQADINSAIVSTIFGIPMGHIVDMFEDFSEIAPHNPNDPHADGLTRARVLTHCTQAMKKILEQPTWQNFANEVKSWAGINSVNELPTREDIEDIYQNTPKHLHVSELKKRFPVLFSPLPDGQMVPEVLVAHNLEQKVRTNRPQPPSSPRPRPQPQPFPQPPRQPQPFPQPPRNPQPFPQPPRNPQPFPQPPRHPQPFPGPQNPRFPQPFPMPQPFPGPQNPRFPQPFPMPQPFPGPQNPRFPQPFPMPQPPRHPQPFPGPQNPRFPQPFPMPQPRYPMPFPMPNPRMPFPMPNPRFSQPFPRRGFAEGLYEDNYDNAYDDENYYMEEEMQNQPPQEVEKHTVRVVVHRSPTKAKKQLPQYQNDVNENKGAPMLFSQGAKLTQEKPEEELENKENTKMKI